MRKKTKVVKLGEDVQHDSAVHLWFKQKRMESTSISGPILSNEKAVQLYKVKMQNSQEAKWRFCGRHGICNLSLQGEKLSADKESKQ